MFFRRFRALALCSSLFAPFASASSAATLTLPKLERTAAAAALGPAASYLSGVQALGVNPAGLHSGRMEFLTQYQRLALQTDLALVGASYPVKPLGLTAGVSYLGMRSSGFDGRDDAGRARGDFSTTEQLFGAHVSAPARAVAGGALQLGASAKMLRMDIGAHSGAGFAFDLGAQYRFAGRPFALGASILNLGSGPALHRAKSDLPTTYLLSGSLNLPSVTVSGNFSAERTAGGQFSIGAEYRLAGALAFRAGYAYLPGASASPGLRNLTYGLGFQVLKRYSLDYAFQGFDDDLRASGLSGTHRVALTLRFDPE